MPWRPALVAAAIGAAFAPLPPAFVERLYSAYVYAGLQPLLTSISNLAPFALFDLLVPVVVMAWIALGARDFARVRGRLRALGVIVWRGIVWSAALYLVFLLIWGLNYRRVRLVDALAVDAARVTPLTVKDAAMFAAERLNALHARAHAAGWPAADAIDPELAQALERAATDTGRARTIVPGRPKRTIFDWYFRRAAVDGMTDPFFLEILVSSELLSFERPFVVAHEWSHLAGIADEGEANFVGWLACLRASPPAQYSGWLFLYGELVRAAKHPDRATIGAALGAGPRADLAAIRDRIARQVSPRVSAAGWRVYDSYLKANRVEAGAASYGEVVRLALGARLASGWEPLSP
jgi:hypothetical protein